MLKCFTVSNFKNFEKKTSMHFDQASNYEFNKEIVCNGCVTKGIVYGINGSGKSNLALAIFDIILHLTDKERSLDKYQIYRNLNSAKTIAEFEYTFDIEGMEVIYKYGKKDATTLTYEKLSIDGVEVLEYNHLDRSGYTILKGAENLQLSSTLVTDSDKLSRVKYVKYNSILEDNEINRAFIGFMTFVDNMLMFYSLKENRYQGLLVGSDSYTEGIIREGKLKEFEKFLSEQGIKYDLVTVDINGRKEMFCKYNENLVPFAEIASTGTSSLALFYYWYLKMSNASFVYIDEFDAFYHFELSQTLIELVKKLKNTQVILSTHNTDLISNDIMRPDAYYIIKDNAIKSFDQISSKELRRAHNIQKMYKAGAFNE